MKKSNALVDRIKIALAIAGVTAVTGCVGFVGDGGGGWWGGDVGGWWGGGHDRGRDVHGYGARGAASRGAAHGGGGGGGHAGGGGGRR